ncbi:nascent polypeptide-associated complex subunit alpha, muscle-specific form-like [Vulpes lagopus]|uniref:nascent polypeptide-associated complex subunit alpha, muscle-specific form-like n=1 Tax=Vulpes lagopus TaxID=494514 RepID=UPI001BC9D81B|nr:nascent polypeptide-associated complex subunit alpha, muscle-specific form-like [Vulpes lagopus]
MATCCLPSALCPSVLKLPLATSAALGDPAAPPAAATALGGHLAERQELEAPRRPARAGGAFAITRHDTNALLKFNLELPISATASQIHRGFLEGAARPPPRARPRSERPPPPAADTGPSEPGAAAPDAPNGRPVPPSAAGGVPAGGAVLSPRGVRGSLLQSVSRTPLAGGKAGASAAPGLRAGVAVFLPPGSGAPASPLAHTRPRAGRTCLWRQILASKPNKPSVLGVPTRPPPSPRGSAHCGLPPAPPPGGSQPPLPQTPPASGIPAVAEPGPSRLSGLGVAPRPQQERAPGPRAQALAFVASNSHRPCTQHICIFPESSIVEGSGVPSGLTLKGTFSLGKFCAGTWRSGPAQAHQAHQAGAPTAAHAPHIVCSLGTVY